MFDHNHNHTCPAEKNSADLNTVAVSIVGSATFQHLLLYICAGCAGVVGLICLLNIFFHLSHFSVPNQQRQIVRILFTPIVFSLFSVFSLLNYNDAIYMPPIRDLYEAFAMAGIFLLFVDYVAPNPATRGEYFSQLESRKPRGGRFSKDKSYDIAPGGSLGWFKIKWIIVFLFVVVDIIITIVQEASQAAGTYCATSLKPYFAHLWVLIIGQGAIAVAVIAILKFYGRMRNEPSFSVHRPLLKLASLKLIVFTNFLQTTIFSILHGQGVLTGNDKITASDLQYGIPSLLVAVEQVIFGLLMHYSFSVKEYKSQGKQMGFLVAAFNALNPLDLIQGVVTAFKYLLGGSGTRGNDGQRTKTVDPNYGSDDQANIQLHKPSQPPLGIASNYRGLPGEYPVGAADTSGHLSKHERKE